jgi:hypothetical protein
MSLRLTVGTRDYLRSVNGSISDRDPIVVKFENPVSDDLYLTLAAAIMTVVDLAGMAPESPSITMTIDPGLDAGYDEVDPFGPARTRKAKHTPSG